MKFKYSVWPECDTPQLVWDRAGLKPQGTLDAKDISSKLLALEMQAKQLLDSSPEDIKHVLYAVKFTSDMNPPYILHFYMKPMTEEEFESKVSKLQDVQVYALHR